MKSKSMTEQLESMNKKYNDAMSSSRQFYDESLMSNCVDEEEEKEPNEVQQDVSSEEEEPMGQREHLLRSAEVPNP